MLDLIMVFVIFFEFFFASTIHFFAFYRISDSKVTITTTTKNYRAYHNLIHY